MPKGLAPIAVLAATAVTAAHLVVSVQHNRRNAHVASEQLHQKLLAAQIADPSLNAIWHNLNGEASDLERQFLHCNRWFSWWSLRLRTGVASRKSLEATIRDAMMSPRVRGYWALTREFRRAEARDRIDRAFNELANDAYEGELDRLGEPA
ncbi:DUF6082 family protein [Streptomyces sp. NPDC051644]|uniref:DUF6082 family protein n=1 Tax=unclassified Streptomyces TaxID=2593676 RepID=UPI0037B23A01